MRKFQVTVNGNTYEVDVEEVGVGASIATPVVQVAAPVAQKAAPVPVAVPAGTEKVVAPMPGKIVDVKVSVGQEIKEGDLVAILEAMKMENEVFATASGKVASVNVTSGAMVESQDVIITVG